MCVNMYMYYILVWKGLVYMCIHVRDRVNNAPTNEGFTLSPTSANKLYIFSL